MITELIEKHASSKPGKAALMFDGGELSYGDLDAQAQIVANGLVRLGLEPGDVVSVGMDPSLS